LDKILPDTNNNSVDSFESIWPLKDPKKIFLTGVTGHVYDKFVVVKIYIHSFSNSGAHLLKQLLIQFPNVVVYCLVRSKLSGEHRFQNDKDEESFYLIDDDDNNDDEKVDENSLKSSMKRFEEV
jgi:hypothetical protein